jgi:pSer/pThr/pTyr-binding forkhead associated (FHA) protein
MTIDGEESRDDRPTRVLLRHTGGSKAGRTDEVPLEGESVVELGHDPSVTVSYEAASDDLVSSHHAKIYPDPHGSGRFLIADLGSANGTYINGYRVFSVAVLPFGDTVHLGAGGPTFVFDVEPRPETKTAEKPLADVAAPTTDAEEAPPQPTSSAAETGGEETGSGSRSTGCSGMLMILATIAAMALILLARSGGSGPTQDLTSGPRAQWVTGFPAASHDASPVSVQPDHPRGGAP